MLTFVCWKWKQENYRTPYSAEHANVWRAGLKRHFPEEHRAICITDDPTGVDFETFPLWADCDKLRNPSGTHLPSCYRRLKIFSSLTTSEMDIDEGDEVVSIDLDVIFVKDITPMFARRGDDFVGWRGPGAYNPVVYNGTLFKFRAGHVDYLWDEFDPVRSPMLANSARYFGSDQGWLSYRLAGKAPGWGANDGILSYTSDVRGSRSILPPNARIVSFNGKRKPWEHEVIAISPWIKDHWRL